MKQMFIDFPKEGNLPKWSNNKSFTGHTWTHPANFSGRWPESLSTWPLTHVYDPAFCFVRFDMIWQLLVKFRQKIQLHFCRTGRFSSFCLVRHLHHHLVWCKWEHAWKQYDFTQHKLGNILMQKQNTTRTNDRKQNKVIEILHQNGGFKDIPKSPNWIHWLSTVVDLCRRQKIPADSVEISVPF